MKRHLIFAICLVTICASAQKQVLFIGNSYTSANDLPSMVVSVASSTGDVITVSSNTPGGCTFNQHCQNQSMTLIRQGKWDVVVLQEQSQYPSFPITQVMSDVFPYAERLVDSVYATNNCPEPMFYMTWGRKNGDSYNAQFYPPLGTYEGMDSLLRERYLYMARTYDASVCPVGKVWHFIRHNYPKINLYQTDESHPSTVGTYAAACAFYTMILEKDPSNITFAPSTMDTATARIIRNVTRQVVFDSLSYWKRQQPEANFTYSNLGNSTATFSDLTQDADSWQWDFGDGSAPVSTGSIVTHTFPTDGTYNVQLIISRHCLYDTVSVEAEINDSTITIDTYADDADNDIITPETMVTIHDATGRLIFNGIFQNAPYATLTPGVYFINRKKIVITRQ